MAAIASGRLSVASDPVAGDGEHERGQSQRAERRSVDEQSGEEAAERADDRSAQKRHGHEHDEQEVGHAAEHVHLREDRYLKDRRDEEEHRGLEAVDSVHRCVFGISAATASSDWSCADGVTCTLR